MYGRSPLRLTMLMTVSLFLLFYHFFLLMHCSLDAFELGNSPDLAFAGPFTIEGGVGGNPASSTNTTVGTSNPVPAAAPASPASGGSVSANNAAAPASPAATAGTSSTSHSASASHAASAATKEQAGQAVAVFGLVAAFASQFF